MYLSYTEYVAMGGTLDGSAFSAAERRAEYLINAQAGGQTRNRLSKLPEVPQAVKDCVFELAGYLSAAPLPGKQVASESQSQGGASESYSYVTMTEEELMAKYETVIEDYFRGGGIGNLLYRGVRYDESCV